MANKVKFVRDNQKPNELKHFGVMGMKWGVRKESYYEPVGPVSNKVAKLGNRGFFKKDVKSIKASSDSASSTRTSGSRYVFQFNKTTFDKVKSWKKQGSSKKGGSGRKSTGTKAKAEEALKEKIASAKKSGGSKKGGGGGKSGKSSAAKAGKANGAETNEKAEEVQEQQDENLISIDPDFNEKFFTAENKLGNTDFYAYKNDNGVWIISDKEKKWVLPEGLEIDKADIAEKLEKFENSIKEIINSTGYEYTEEELDMWRTAAINKIISELRTPQQETNERIAEVINNLLGGKAEEITDKSNETKIGDNVSKVLEDLEDKKKR